MAQEGSNGRGARVARCEPLARRFGAHVSAPA
jgi:hypothetical protein